MNLSQDIQDGLKECGYQNPTEVQEKAIPIALENKDLIVRSKQQGCCNAHLDP